MSFDPGTPWFPTRCCSPFLPSSPLPPLAFSFTFYAPISTPTASYFYSEEPANRTRVGIVELDAAVWGGKEKEEGDDAERFIRDAIGSGGRDGREGIVVKGRASRGMDESGRESGRKRKREESETRSIREDEGEGRYDKRIRSEKVEDEGYGSEGGARIDVERPTRRNSRPSPSYEVVPKPDPVLPFRRQIDTGITTLHHFLARFDVEPYLTSNPMDPSHSHQFFFKILQFMAFVEPPSSWESSRGQILFQRKEVNSLTELILTRSPNVSYIREKHPLRSVRIDKTPYNAEEDSVFGETRISLQVLNWVWGGSSNTNELRWVVEKSPLPLFAMFLEYVSLFRFFQAVRHAQTRFMLYLTHTPSLSPRCQRGKILIDWLESFGGNRRWRLMFDSQEGEGGDEKWEWWFDLDEERTLKDLDEWEKRELERLERGRRTM